MRSCNGPLPPTRWKNVRGLGARARRELVDPKDLMRISEDELQFVTTGSEESKFTCKECAQEFSKRYALARFTRTTHKMPAEVVEKWVVVSDANAMRNKRHHKLKLSEVLRLRAVVHAKDSDEEIAEIAKKLPVPLSWRSAVRRRLRQKSKRSAYCGA